VVLAYFVHTDTKINAGGVGFYVKNNIHMAVRGLVGIFPKIFPGEGQQW